MQPLRLVSSLLCGLLFTGEAAQSATHAEVMFSRYMRYQFCMEKTLGQGFYPRLGIETAMNKWGNSEPRLRSIIKQPAAVQKVDAACRKANDIGTETRPQ